MSDTIIYNQLDPWQKKYHPNYKDLLLKQANAILQLQTTASELSDSDQDLQDLFEIVKTAIRDQGVVFLSKEEPVRLTRKNAENIDVPAYMNIDYLIEREELRNTIYDNYKHFAEALQKQGHNIELKHISIPVSDDQETIQESSKEELNQFIDNQLSDLITELRIITQTRHITIGEKREIQAKKILFQIVCLGNK